MKWFKHMANGHKSESLSKIKGKFGLEGVARWYILLEVIAEKMDESDRCHAEFSVSDWMRILEIKQQKHFRQAQRIRQDQRQQGHPFRSLRHMVV